MLADWRAWRGVDKVDIKLSVKKGNKQQRAFFCGDKSACDLAPAGIGTAGSLESFPVLLSTLYELATSCEFV